MFTIEQIKAAHAKVKSGADFPAYVQELKTLGLRRYEHYLADGHTDYHGANGFTIRAQPKWTIREISDNVLVDQFKKYIQEHQQGKSDYPTICQQAAACGIEKWIVDLEKMTCTYYDKKDNKLIVEEIPEAVNI